jgi:AraC family transcriptional regulator
MKPRTADDYRSRLGRVLDHLSAHLDDELNLADLARIAHFSPYHFHRIFRSVTGESVAGLVRRLRLERAARALRQSDASVLDIALTAGYGTPEAFARSFREAFGRTPSEHRRAVSPTAYTPALPLALKLDPASLRITLEPAGGTIMDVRVETFPERLAACLRHVGPYEQLMPSFQRMYRWAGPAGVLTPQTMIIGLSYDDLESVPAEALRYDVCFTLIAPVPVPDGIRIDRIRGGRCAVHILKGPYSGIGDAFRRLFGLWLPASGEEVDDRPCMEIYLNDPTEVSEAELLTKICVPLRSDENARTA